MSWKTLKLQRESETSLLEQIVQYFEEAIKSSGLPYGSKMPSIRDFAQQHQLSKGSVMVAYERLTSFGFIKSKPGSGFYVSWSAEQNGNSSRTVNKPFQNSHSLLQGQFFTLDEKNFSSSRDLENFMIQGQSLKPADLIPLGVGYCVPDLIPMDDFRSIARQVLAEHGLGNLGFEHTGGLLAFRKQVVKELQNRQIPVDSPDQVLVVGGILAPLNLALELFVQKGDFVLMEAPSSPVLFSLVQSRGLQVLEIPRSPARYHISEELKSRLLECKPRVFIVTPDFHNPTGGVLDPSSRFSLLTLAKQIGAMVIEYDLYAQLQFGDHLLPSLSSLDGLQSTIYVSSYSRNLAAGLKVSFAVFPKEYKIQAQKIAEYYDYSASNIDQSIMKEFLSKGYYHKHLLKVRESLRSRRDTLLGMLQKLAPKGSSWTTPEGGGFLWFSFPEGASTDKLAQIALEKKIMIAPESSFYASFHEGPHMRLAYGSTQPVHLYSSLEQVFAIWRHLSSR